MLKQELIYKLTQSIQTCIMHHSRMMFAYNQLCEIFPLNESGYSNLSSTQISYCDQLIYRFSKLQDTIGNKLFRIILEGLGENQEDMALIDVLSRLEKLKIIESQAEWLQLRELRNIVTHEYPFNTEEIIEGLNTLIVKSQSLSEIWLKMENYLQIKLNI